MMTRRIRNGWLGTAFAFLALAAGAVAQIHPGPVQPGPHPVGLPSGVPAPRISIAPLRVPLPKMSLAPIPERECNRLLRKAKNGDRIPVRCLPHIPRKTIFNTVGINGKFGKGHYRPNAATGATIQVNTASGCSTSGDLYNTNCIITYQGVDLAPGFTSAGATDTIHCYYLASNSTTATVWGTQPPPANSNPVCNGGTTGGVTGGVQLSSNGPWMFGIYDDTERDWLAVVYVNVGTEYNLAVYQDPFHTQQAYQYDVNSSGSAYIQLTNVVASDRYVVYVLSTAVRSYCVYLTPAGGTPTPLPPSPRPTGSPNALLCNPSIETGVTAPGGTLDLTWQLSSSYEAGSYSVVAYDQTAGQTLAEVQVSLTASSSNTLVMYPTPTAGGSPSAPSTPANTKFAWDSSNDQSDAGIVAVTATAEPTGNYTWTVQDPNGVTVAVATPTNSSVGTMTQQFNFTNMSPAINSPGYYANNIWVWQLYNRSTKSMVASQAFQMVGYSTETQFCTASCTTTAGGTLSNNLSFATGGLSSADGALVFTNNANTVFPNASDNIAEIAFTTGPASTLATNYATTLPDAAAGSGGALFSFAANQDCYVGDGGCTRTETDSNGNAWTATIYCSEDPGNPAAATGSANTGSGVYYTSQCVLLAKPVSSGVYLTPGASLVVEGSGTGNTLTWYVNSANGNWPCHTTACSTVTSELPADGVSWSATNTSTSSWNAVQYGTSGSATGTADLSFMGTTVTRATATPAPTSTPWPAGHYYNANFNQADYYASKPFSVSNHFDILDVHINNTGSLNFVANANQGNAILAVTFPSYYTATSVTMDSLSSANYQICDSSNTHSCTHCPTGFGPSTVCIWGSNVNSGNSGDVYLDVPLPTSSFVSSEAVVQVSAQGTSGWTTLSSAGTSTAVVGGGNASGLTYDGLALAAYDLDNNLINAGFNPTTVGTGSNPTAFTINITNPSTGSDPNPDPIDLVVVEQKSSTSYTISGTPSFLINGASNTQASGWSYLGTYNPTGNNVEYWFGVCNNQFNNRTSSGGAPPQTPPSETNPSTTQSSQVPFCTTAQEANALKAGDQLTIDMSLAGTFSAGAFNFYAYAHGANEGGWSGSMTMPVTFASEAATNQFFYTGSSAPTSGSTTTNVTTNTVASISTTPNYYIYEITNTSSSASTKISTIKVTIPAFDINGLSASDGTYSWNWKTLLTPVVGTISSGKWTNTNAYGCTYNSAGSSDPVAGSTNGTIEIDCTNFAGGSSENIALEFEANAPQTESSTYEFPVKIDANTASPKWTGSDEIQVLYTLGLSVAVDPSNPGPGGSTPTVSCSQCSFSGTTINFGIITPAGTSVTGTDVARATVVNTAVNSGHTWNLSESVNANTNNLFFMAVDKNNSSSAIQADIPAGVQSFFAPSATSTTLVSGGPETSVADYDTIMSYKVCTGTACGASANDTTGHTVIITYTLIGN